MKHEEYRPQNLLPTPLPKAEPRPCMRYVIDMNLYNATGEIKMIEQPTEYVPPTSPTDNPFNKFQKKVWKGMKTVNPNKPSKEALKDDLKAGLSVVEIAKKYTSQRASVYNWLRSYGLQGFKDLQRPTPDEVAQAHPENEIQEFPVEEMSEPLNITLESEKEQPAPFAPYDPFGEPQFNSAAQLDEPINQAAPRETFDEIWQDVHASLHTLERLYVAQARKSFRDKLREMLADVAGRDIEHEAI